MRRIARRSLVALTEISKGEPLTLKNVGARRPGHGLPPSRTPTSDELSTETTEGVAFARSSPLSNATRARIPNSRNAKSLRAMSTPP